MFPAELDLALRTRSALASGEARDAREALKVRQADVADVLGVSRQVVSLWERGERTPTARNALAYGKLLQRLTEQAA